jgi:hypothetical protein
MRSLDLYTEKQTSDSSPDKIAAHNAFVREANSLSLSSLAKDTPIPSFVGSQSVQIDDKSSVKVDEKPGAKTDEKVANKTGLLSLFCDFPDGSPMTNSRDGKSPPAKGNEGPLSWFALGGSRAGRENFTRQELQEIADRSVVHERMQRVIARQAFLLKEKRLKDEKGDRGENEQFEQVNDTTTMTASLVGKMSKLSFIKDKVSIARGAIRLEKIGRNKGPRDVVKENKLLKKKQMLVDYLEKFRGKLSLQEVSEVISQMEKLDKALLLMAT